MADKTDDSVETPEERANRELIELLNELRVVLPGVQVLFAFLLTVPFSTGFDKVDAGDRKIYFAAVLATAAATVFLIAPSAHHRIRFREGVKEQLLRVATVFAIIGLALLAFAMSAVTYVVSDVLYDGTVASIAAAGLAGGAIVVWFIVPFAYRPDRTPPPD